MGISKLLGKSFEAEPSSLQDWRERILSVFLWVMVVFGTLAYVVNIIPAFENGDFALIAFYTAAFIWVLANTILTKIPYKFRASSMLAIAYLLGPVSLLLGGLTGDGRIWLMFFIIFTSILFGLRAGIGAAVLSFATFAAFAVLFAANMIPAPEIDGLDPIIWLSTGVVLLWLSVTIFVSVSMLLQGLERSQESLEKSLATEKSLNVELSQEYDQMVTQSEGLEKRLTQIRAAAEISRLISAELNPLNLMQKVVDLLKERFDLYYAGVFLMDDNKFFANLTAGTGEAGRRMMAENHKLAVGGSSMVGWATANREARIALDVGQEAIRFNNPHLPLTRSELALPLLRGREPIGAFTIQSTEPEAFDEDDIVVLQGIADSMATAIENAQFVQRIEENLDEIRKLNRLYLREGWSEMIASEPSLSYSTDSNLSSDEDQKSDYLEVPMKLRGQEVVGSISLLSDRSDWSPQELEFIEAVSSQAAMAVESARLLNESQQRVQRELALGELTAKFSRSLDVDSLMQVVVRELGKLPHVKEVSLNIAPPTARSENFSNGDNAND